ncbi:hypothetical protein KI688_001087 [Linnemannia hyalina]|uniref:F-box domain-containing protein n=1 Tax=Linnemannia hyalina TaxID=64524 RepID=A0A9P7Y5C7_9FUNG|nr:hypothetical protein KI688_001087 [Linnemannia hyalina]
MTPTQKQPFLMRSLFSSKKHLRAKNGFNDIPTPSPTSQQLALSIPEILENILSFLSLKSRQDASQLVCKQWYAVCKGLIPVSYNWILRLTPSDNNSNDIDMEERIIIEGISSANNIIVKVDGDTSVAGTSKQRLNSWATMMDMLSSIVQDHNDRRRHLRLQSIHLREGILENFAVQLPQLPALTTLSTLRIDVIVRWDIIHLLTILKACPNLEELSVKPTYAADIPYRSTHLAANQDFAITSQGEFSIMSKSNVQKTMTRLRMCSLHNMTIALPALRAILEASPLLSRLDLLRCKHLVRPGETSTFFDGQRAHSLNYTAFIIRLVGQHCPNLKIFHLSPSRGSGHGLSTPEAISILNTFPHMEECNLTDQKIDAGLLKSLKAVTNRITTLNIVPVYLTTSFTGGIPLREILCTFQHLVHLRAPNAIYYIEDMDLNDVQGQLLEINDRKHGTNRYSTRSTQPIRKDDPDIARQYIWACRGLKTLHMAVGYRRSDSNSTETSLIIFGFLSRMCPLLQELHLKRWVMNLKFAGGLSLLTRLQDLERVRIQIDRYYRADKECFSWLKSAALPSTWGGLTYPLVHRRARNDLRRRYQELPPPEVANAESKLVERGQELGIELAKVGHGDDLLDWMDDHYGVSASASHRKERLTTLPKLQLFWIEFSEQRGGSDWRKLEAFVAGIRPSVDFQMRTISGNVFYSSFSQYY